MKKPTAPRTSAPGPTKAIVYGFSGEPVRSFEGKDAWNRAAAWAKSELRSGYSISSN